MIRAGFLVTLCLLALLATVAVCAEQRLDRLDFSMQKPPMVIGLPRGWRHKIEKVPDVDGNKFPNNGLEAKPSWAPWTNPPKTISPFPTRRTLSPFDM